VWGGDSELPPPAGVGRGFGITSAGGCGAGVRITSAGGCGRGFGLPPPAGVGGDSDCLRRRALKDGAIENLVVEDWLDAGVP